MVSMEQLFQGTKKKSIQTVTPVTQLFPGNLRGNEEIINL